MGSRFTEGITVMGIVVLGVVAMLTLKLESKDIIISAVSGLIGFLSKEVFTSASTTIKTRKKSNGSKSA